MCRSNKIAVQGGLVPLLVSMVACLYPSHPVSAAPEPALPAQNNPTDTTDATINPSPTLNLSVMSITGHIEPYVDQYLVESNEADDWYAKETTRRGGRRLIGAQFVYYQNSNDVVGDSTELGLRTTMRQETRNFGELDAEFIFSDHDSNYITQQRSNSEVMFTLRQTGVPVADHWTMNNILGYQRTAISPVLNGGFRVRLPSSPLVGLSGQLINSNKDFFWFTGKTGYYEGTAMRQFRKDGGELFGGAYQQEVMPMLWFGGEIVNFSGNDLVRKHSSLLVAGQYARPDQSMQYDFHLLADNDSNLGLWADGMQYLPADFQLRYGAFYLQPDLAWMDRPIANNQSGLYLRTDKQAFLYTFSAGYDYMDTGMEGGILPGVSTHSAFFNGNYRVTRKLTLGLNANLGLRNIDSLQSDEQTFWRLNNFVFYKFPVGTSRLEVYAAGLSSKNNTGDDNRQGLRFSHDWRLPQSLRLTTEVRLEETTRFGQDRSYREAAMRFHQDVGDNWTWGINASAYQDTGGQSSYDGFGLNADMRWNFLQNWHASLNVLYNANEIDIEDFGLDDFEDKPKSSSVWLTFNYSKATGQPLMNLGRSNGGAGSGRVSGTVFYDENRDFIRQPGEEPAAGVIVLLDGRYEAMTDSEGRYTFDPVHTGVHRVSVITEDLPLPWSLYDEAPRRVEVNLRRTGEVDFPLVRIN